MHLIDISHPLNENTPVYPGDSTTVITKFNTFEKDGYTAFTLQSSLHTGTHIDAPMHLTDDSRFINDFPADRFISNGVLLDVRGDDVIAMKPEYERMVKEQDIVLLYTGFDKYYGEPSYFTNHPVMSDELAQFFISKQIKMLGLDMPSPDRVPFSVHKALLKSGIFLLENLTNLNSLIGYENFEVIALPIKIAAEASFVRAVCMVK